MQMLDSIFTKTHCSGTWTLTPLQHARNFQKDQEEQRTARTQKSLRTRTYEKSQNSIVIPVCDKKEENPQVESYSSWNCGQVNPFPYGFFFAFLHCEANSSFRTSFETLPFLFFETLPLKFESIPLTEEKIHHKQDQTLFFLSRAQHAK